MGVKVSRQIRNPFFVPRIRLDERRCSAPCSRDQKERSAEFDLKESSELPNFRRRHPVYGGNKSIYHQILSFDVVKEFSNCPFFLGIGYRDPVYIVFLVIPPGLLYKNPAGFGLAGKFFIRFFSFGQRFYA